MFNASELKVIELLLILQISELQDKLRFYRAIRKYARIDELRKAIKHFEDIREKVVHMKKEVKQIEIKED